MSDSEDYDDSSSDGEVDDGILDRGYEVAKSPSQEDLLPLLECPVCLDLPLPPIRTCYQGHIICAGCSLKLTRCPLCKKRIGIGRNFFAEDFINQSLMKCKYNADGCLTQVPGSKIKEHMELCRYRPLKCRQCGRKVSFSNIDHHLLSEHHITKWDLNDGGTRIILCQKARTKNPCT